MKKKTIEKIPYLKLKNTVRSRKVKFIAVTALKVISHEKHLFVEVYENKKASMDIPVVRIVLTKKDYGNYFPEKGCWTSERIKNNAYYSMLIWDDTASASWKDVQERDKVNILQDESDLKRIENFCEKKWKSKISWFLKINVFENDILNKKRIRAAYNKNKRRQKALNERAKLTPKLDLEAIAKRADKEYFKNKHYLYYRKNGSFATIGCSNCGKVFTGRWKDEMSYESQFQYHVPEPVKGFSNYCPGCGAFGEFKPQGNTKPFYTMSIFAYTASPYKKNGIIVRYIELKKDWQMETDNKGKGEEIVGASERIHAEEIARAYIEPGKDTQIDYHKYNPYTKMDFWDDCNLSFYENPIRIKDAIILPETYDVLEKTSFKYCQLKTFEAAAGSVRMIDYMEMYQRYPQIEFLVKLGLYEVVKKIISYQCSVIANEKSKKLHEFLGIRKEHTQLLLKHKDNIDYLRTLQMIAGNLIKKMQFTERQIDFISMISVPNYRILNTFERIPVQKFINRVEKYSGVEFREHLCSNSLYKLSQTAETYIDYLNMRNELGYDMNNTVYLFPRDLQAAHDRMVREQNEKKDDIHIKKMMSQFPNIQHSYRKLRKEYFYEDDEYVIRPARSAKEIILEGRTLHHCVGGTTYLSNHNELKSIILFLRFKNKKETPYITVEVKNDSKNMMQWYGAHDKKPDKANIDKWLNDYIENLKKQQFAEKVLDAIAI